MPVKWYCVLQSEKHRWHHVHIIEQCVRDGIHSTVHGEVIVPSKLILHCTEYYLLRLLWLDKNNSPQYALLFLSNQRMTNFPSVVVRWKCNKKFPHFQSTNFKVLCSGWKMALSVKAFDASRWEVCTDAEWLQSKEESPPSYLAQTGTRLLPSWHQNKALQQLLDNVQPLITFWCLKSGLCRWAENPCLAEHGAIM